MRKYCSPALSPFSNLYAAKFSVDNITYNCVEQLIQCDKARLFDDDVAVFKITNESNLYKIKKLGTKVRNFNLDRWRKHAKRSAQRGVFAKFSQNNTLKTVLLQTGSKPIAESTQDPFWGVGLHLHDNRVMNKKNWLNKDGGVMCEIINRVRHELNK